VLDIINGIAIPIEQLCIRQDCVVEWGDRGYGDHALILQKGDEFKNTIGDALVIFGKFLVVDFNAIEMIGFHEVF